MFEESEDELAFRDAYHEQQVYNYARNFKHSAEEGKMKGFHQKTGGSGPSRIKRPYVNPLFESFQGEWEEEAKRKPRVKEEETHYPTQNLEGYYQSFGNPDIGFQYNDHRDQFPREPPWGQPRMPVNRDQMLREQVIGLIQEVCGSPIRGCKYHSL